MAINVSGSLQAPGAARADIDGVLAQIRRMQAHTRQEIQGAVPSADVARTSAQQRPEPTDFSAMLGGALKQVNALQKASSKAASDFVTGKSDDLVATMLASQKSSVAIQATIQVRNRVVSAYQDIMNMPI
jgi:flagellar hook-basal body complex protein FliE